MQTYEFLSAVLGGDGYICIFGANPAKKRIVQKLYSTVDSAISAAANLCDEGFDAYFGVAKYATDTSRRADNVQHLNALFLDIDCNPEKPETEGYPAGQEDGLDALRDFVRAYELPDPIVISSGRGLHVYWLLDEPALPEEWLPVAEGLKAACQKHGLKADPVVTSDLARVLRVPGTQNFKTTPPTDVVFFEGELTAHPLETFRSAFEVTEAPRPPLSAMAQDDPVADAIIGNYQNIFKTIVLKTSEGNGCAQLLKIMTEQETMSEPMWRGGLSIAKFCVDGRRAAHKISSNHPEYSEDATERKLDQIKGPYTCETFDKLNPGVCPNCKHYNKIKSPIILGREVQEAEGEVVVEEVPHLAPLAGRQAYTIPTYPKPYFRGAYGGVFKRTKDKQGDPTEIPVYHNDLYVVRRLTDPEAGESLVVRLHLPKDGVREFTIPLASMLSRDEFRKYMAMNGVAVIKMDELMSYMTSWVNKLQAELEADIARRQFGWTDATMSRFVVGAKEIHGNRVEHNPPSSATVRLFPAMQSHGSLDEWKRVADFFNRPGMEMHQYVVALSFGSPLVAFSPDGSALFHMYSRDSGFGKTTAMKVGNSIWGDPGELMLMERDTYNSKMHRAEVFKNIFLTIDELTNMQPKDASDMIYQFTGAKQRNRMNVSSNTERYRGDQWKLNVASTGNTSLLSRIMMYKAMPKAESVRMIEVHAKAFAFDSKAETDDFGRRLHDNYGLACVPFMQCVISKMDESRDLFLSMQERIDKAADLSQVHRFWSAQAASALSGLMIAKRIGLVNYDIPNLFNWIVDRINDNKKGEGMKRQDAEEILTSYLAENYNNVLRIRSTDDSRSAESTDMFILPDSVPRAQLIARYEYDIRRLYLLPKPFREWCGKAQIPYQDVVAELCTGRTKGKMKKVRLGKGTRMNLPPVDALMLECQDFMNEEREESIADLHVNG